VPIGTTSSNAQVGKVVLPGERRNKTPLYVPGVRKTRRFLDLIREKSASKLMAKMKGEILILFPETADGFRVTIGTW
jgi:hypothetical protein